MTKISEIENLVGIMMLSIIKNEKLLKKVVLIIIFIISSKSIFSQNFNIDSIFSIGNYEIDVLTSKNYELYSNVENQIIIRLLGINAGNIYLIPLVDSSLINIKTTFLVIDNDWNFELVEDARKSIPIEGLIKIELVPKPTEKLYFDLFVKDSLTNIHFARFYLKVENLPEPKLNILKLDSNKVKIENIINEFNKVKVLNLSNYKNYDDLFGVNHMKLTIYDKKENIIYQGYSFSDYITTDIQKEIMNCKKGYKICVDEIYSKGFEYKSINIIVEK